MENETQETETPADDAPGNDKGAGAASLESITADLVGEAPTVNDAAVEAHENKEAETRAAYADLRDAQGMSFDPEIHVTDSDGAPKLTLKGKLRRRPGRKANTANVGGKVSPGGISHDPNGLTPQQKLQARQSGDAAAGALIMLGVALGGDEWQPRKDDTIGLDERAALSGAFGDYFEAKEMTDIPPGVALTIVVSAYALPRFTMPQTKTRVQRFKEWAAGKIAARKMRKKENKDNGTLSDSGDDGKRENDSSKGTS